MTAFDVAIGLPLCLAFGVGLWWADSMLRIGEKAKVLK